MNSYLTLQDEKCAVEKFLNRKAQEAMCCLDTQGPSDYPSTTPDELPSEDIPNIHDQTMDQVPHTYQASKHEHYTLLNKLLQILPDVLPKFYRLNMSFW